ncbi:hypothetical protein CP973_39195 [Streptomyces albofaciens JCM 4342]|uniref:hypothetical protein n=1 Tax=Streptomyces albofaciens TaxID=66866 RepID=UPI000B140317|nr:hypothetical protein [Streptomyces albofaciens]KAA6215032.1 hypothetical protein CP973_39195 [Streptomyces albofaciens JCM 4342]
MALRFIAKDPNTGSDQSPTVWIDEENGDLVLQGWKADRKTTDECREVGSIPAHEAVVRIPARMTSIVREACDAADQRAELR